MLGWFGGRERTTDCSMMAISATCAPSPPQELTQRGQHARIISNQAGTGGRSDSSMGNTVDESRPNTAQLGTALQRPGPQPQLASSTRIAPRIPHQPVFQCMRDCQQAPLFSSDEIKLVARPFARTTSSNQAEYKSITTLWTPSRLASPCHIYGTTPLRRPLQPGFPG